jgi:hypothetical protein
VHVQAGLDDPHPQAVDPGQAGPVGQDLIDWRLAGGAAADQEMSPAAETSFIRSAASQARPASSSIPLRSSGTSLRASGFGR